MHLSLAVHLSPWQGWRGALLQEKKIQGTPILVPVFFLYGSPSPGLSFQVANLILRVAIRDAEW